MWRALTTSVCLLVFSTSAVAAPRWARNPQHISVDLKSAEIRGLIAALAEAGRMNVVIADDVSGSVTLRVHDLSWESALRGVLAAKQLGMVAEGNVLRVDTAAHLEEEASRAQRAGSK